MKIKYIEKERYVLIVTIIFVIILRLTYYTANTFLFEPQQEKLEIQLSKLKFTYDSINSIENEINEYDLLINNNAPKDTFQLKSKEEIKQLQLQQLEVYEDVLKKRLDKLNNQIDSVSLKYSAKYRADIQSKHEEYRERIVNTLQEQNKITQNKILFIKVLLILIFIYTCLIYPIRWIYFIRKKKPIIF